ncbi:nuclear transcription factor Y subunit beta isoform X2 [Pararge aegeria]|nr:nuclear transcription factor Y subunit beta isoform X2 [Pararge aegeria]
MYRLLILTLVFQFTICQQYQQKVAPGVPPQNYQQQQYQQPPPPPQQQYQQPPQQQQQYQQQQPQQQQQQFQQPPQQQQFQQQQQQPPQQQYQQQVPVQQMPVQQTPQGHGHHGNDPHILDAANIAHEREHIQEHMDVPIDTSKMSDQELQFHYFKMHDADNNNKLDGCELIKSLIHWHEQGHNNKQQPQPGTPPAEEKIFKDDELTNLIDPILNMDDHNRDGFIDYPEFIRAQQKNQNKEG